MSTGEGWLERYAERAKSAGTEVEVLLVGELEPRLEALVQALEARTAALHEAGWPPEVHRAVLASLTRSGCSAVAPTKAGQEYAWDRDRLASAGLGITWCGTFLADTGSLVFPSGPGLGTLASLLPYVHLALSYPAALRPDLAAYLGEIGGELPSRLTLVSGPSRTGDIEGTMSTGVHGPGRVLHWILDDRSS